MLGLKTRTQTKIVTRKLDRYTLGQFNDEYTRGFVCIAIWWEQAKKLTTKEYVSYFGKESTRAYISTSRTVSW